MWSKAMIFWNFCPRLRVTRALEAGGEGKKLAAAEAALRVSEERLRGGAKTLARDGFQPEMPACVLHLDPQRAGWPAGEKT